MSWAGGLIGAGAGLIAGSFVATISIRWPAGRSATRGRSACDACGIALNAIDLIPVAGFLIRRGRCRACSARIDRRHLAIELACAAIGAVALAVAPGAAGAAGALFGWLLLLLAVLDVDQFWLPDQLTLPLALIGVAAGAAGLPPFPNDRLIGAAAGYASLGLIAWAYKRVRGRDGLGGGDPKLFGAIGAWLGWSMLPLVLVLACAIGLAAALAAYLRGDKVGATTEMPLGALLAVAAWPIWVWTAGR